LLNSLCFFQSVLQLWETNQCIIQEQISDSSNKQVLTSAPTLKWKTHIIIFYKFILWPVSFPILVGQMYSFGKVSSYTMDSRLFLRQKQWKHRSSPSHPKWFLGSSSFISYGSSWKNIWSPTLTTKNAWSSAPCPLQLCDVQGDTVLLCSII
jgi:hypothetical protein